MDFYDVLDQVLDLLRQRGRVAYRVLKLQFKLDAEALEALKDELIYSQRLAAPGGGRAGADGVSSSRRGLERATTVAKQHEVLRMSTSTDVAQITYPQSDGQPMADNTKQFRWIVTIQGGLDALLREDPQVFVAGDLLWYPVEGHPEMCLAPDVMVAFGRPKGDRGSYMQWEEGGIAPQVVFEIRSPGNTIAMMTRKFRFYERHGVVEYYLYDPDTGELSGWQRQGETLEEIEPMEGWISPRLGIRFELERGALQLYRPDGERFATYVELMEQREQERQRAEQEHQRAEQEHQRAESLAARLRALGIEPEEA